MNQHPLWRAGLALLFVAAAPCTAIAGAPDDILGRYWNPDRTGQIEVFRKADKFFGKIVWRQENVFDTKNPAPDLQKRSVIGMVFLKDFVFNGDDAWVDGTVYSFQNGKTYSGRLRIDDGDLVMRGYVMLRMFGKTVRMARVKPGEERPPVRHPAL